MLTRAAGYGPGMTDDPGVMGNLPRSRPGRRSSKRGGATGESTKPKAAAASKAAGGKSAAGRSTAKKPAAAKPAAAKRTRTAGSTTASARGRTSASAGQRKPSPPQGDQGAPRQEQVTQGSTDPVTGAVLLAGKVVEGGLKVAGGIIKRLPRP
jgi:hypothetical protein